MTSCVVVAKIPVISGEAVLAAVDANKGFPNPFHNVPLGLPTRPHINENPA